ncbi:MSEP-CTERM sorting domain-containing protein [Hymenobacter lucidus]|uniref:MSEP-CTERM sorting domain-containing protein n=1 Tax=Hymenobacter lucidus TaxID=2880930 RepID=A0ABS8APK6_9BACT|nr:MSEP-CTERM sorting domain-containing protein [Hymenobacter lucidus]MCB2408142.1 MSEP-CTERM sorting domain-containing protein [Hymenobacter lucidus]
MRNLLNPKWLLLLNTLPLVLLAGLCYGQFTVIQSLLPPASLVLWQQFALALAGLGLSTLTYALVQLRRGRPVEWVYSALALVAYTTFALLYIGHDSEIVPFAVPRWMVPTDLAIYVVTFIMPTLAHAMFALVVRLTPADRSHTAALNFALAFAAPAALYVLMWLPSTMLERFERSWEGPLLAVLLISCSFCFLFFLVRGAYILAMRRAEDAELHLLWKVLISLVLPMLGLLVNNGFLLGNMFGGSGSHDRGVFGNFNSPWFYALAVLNGLLLCLPDSPDRWRRLAVFLGRSVLFGYTFYFFIVFLPFLPLSILAVILIGAGFLMLAPLLLLVLHVHELAADLEFLTGFFARRWLRAGLVAGGLTLPLIITGQYLHNRWVLHEALDYRYTPDYTRRYHLDEQALARTLNVIKQHKERANDFSSSHVPYLSMYFNWLVLDNLTLSDDKITSLEQLFLGAAQEPEYEQPQWQRFAGNERPGNASGRPALTSLTTRSRYDARQQAWVSWLDLTVANTDARLSNGEYSTSLELPVGCWVGDYYLDINGRREPGVLAEKRTAAWVYAQILNENQNRDPGLLSYLDARHVSLRVFPVAGNVARTTGIQLLHKEPVRLTVDGRTVLLGDSSAQPLARPVATPDQAVVYVSAAAKKALPLVQRKPYYHFLLDASAGQGNGKAAYAARINRHFAQEAATAQARFTLVDAYATPVAPTEKWQEQLARHESTGGFYLDGALRQLLFKARQSSAATYPLIAVVTDSLHKAILGQNLAELSSAYPETDQFYVLGADDSLAVHSLRSNSRAGQMATSQPVLPVPVRAWPDVAHVRAYLPDDESADIVLNEQQVALPQPGAGTSRWQMGLLLHGYQQWQAFHPEATDEQRVPFVQASFRAGILTPFTAYLALENEAQKAALRRKQDEVLKANTALDLDESTEPAVTEVPIDGGASLLLAAGAALGIRRLRRRKRAGVS